MLRGDRVGLRARRDADIPVLVEDLYNDVETRSGADSRPWVPIAEGGRTPYTIDDTTATAVCFSAVELATDDLLGDCLLWGIDEHNRLAHIGISLRPSARGKSFARDVVHLLCHYGFVVRGFNRLQIETLADNAPMRRVAESLGFVHEATLRRSAWVLGEFQDEVVYGLLASEWRTA